ncbi:MAG TPA: glycosyltransferase family 1 protein [Patescibacteria group bacterium]|nr:glycosyltransferase family 1 protein [Patescibacteria group bacterium]
MKIGLDARFYGSHQGGIGRYLEELVSALARLNEAKKHVFYLFLKDDVLKNFSPPAPNFIPVKANIAWYGATEQLILPQILKKVKLDLMHFPHWNVPLLYPGKYLLTIHDLLLLHYPSRRNSQLGPIKYAIKNLAFKKVLKNSITKAAHIISPSLYTKEDIVKNFNIPEEKISVINLGTSALNTTSDLNPNTLKKYGVTKPFLLYVGVAFPHKNLEGLVDAWKLFIEKYGNQHELVLVGKKNYFYDRLYEKKIKNKVKNIILTDYVPDNDLTEFYRQAKLYIFPSFYEGFGLPPLEALQFGLPVISSWSTCLPEILKNAAHFFDPHSPKAMAEAIALGLNDQNLRTKLLNESKKILPLYNWQTTAEKTLELYERFTVDN